MPGLRNNKKQDVIQATTLLALPLLNVFNFSWF